MCIRDSNYSQGTVVRNKKVVAIEGRGGTEKMLKKCNSKKFRNNGVLVKFPKKKQDLRIDLPTVGLKTLKKCKSVGLKGIILKNKQNVFLEKNKCISFANKNKLFMELDSFVKKVDENKKEISNWVVEFDPINAA